MEAHKCDPDAFIAPQQPLPDERRFERERERDGALNEFMSDIRGGENHFRSSWRWRERRKGGPFSTETAEACSRWWYYEHLHNESAKWNFFYAPALVLLLHVAQQCQALPFCCHRLHDLLDGGAIGWFTPATMKESCPGREQKKLSRPLSMGEEVSKAFTREKEFFPPLRHSSGISRRENKLSSKALLLNRKKIPRNSQDFCFSFVLLASSCLIAARDGIWVVASRHGLLCQHTDDG